MVRTFVSEYGDIATLEIMGNDTYYVDMHCALWNRSYKSEIWAIRYLMQSGYREVCDR